MKIILTCVLVLCFSVVIGFIILDWAIDEDTFLDQRYPLSPELVK